MALQRVDELAEPPVPGQFYRVPTVHGHWFDRERWWPVMGGRHEDTKFFRFSAEHYHLDRRFLPAERDVSRAFDWPLHAQDRLGHGLSEVVWRRRLCHRTDHYFPIWHPEVQAMQESLGGTRCKVGPGGLICPHRGFALGSVASDSRGVVTCPLHGLQVVVATGVVIGDTARLEADA